MVTLSHKSGVVIAKKLEALASLFELTFILSYISAT